MPIYEYVCRDCRHEFEVLVRSDEKPVCPNCGCSRLNKQLSVPAAHTAGSAPPACPMKDPRNCGAANCCGYGCHLDE